MLFPGLTAVSMSLLMAPSTVLQPCNKFGSGGSASVTSSPTHDTTLTFQFNNDSTHTLESITFELWEVTIGGEVLRETKTLTDTYGPSDCSARSASYSPAWTWLLVPGGHYFIRVKGDFKSTSGGHSWDDVDIGITGL